MIDNFELIRSLLTFPNDDTYYHLQIIRRGKDHPNLPAANRTIKSYFICSLGGFDYIEDEVKKLCEFFGARAYINLAPKSIKKTTILQLKYLAERVYIGDYKKIWRSWNTCAGEIKGKESRWVVDIDRQLSEEEYDKLLRYLVYLKPLGNKFIAKVPTKSGIHLITTPFDLQQFKEQCPDIEVHRNNPTLLYCL